MSIACPIYSNKLFKQFLKFISHNCIKYHTKLFTSSNSDSTSYTGRLSRNNLGFTNFK